LAPVAADRGPDLECTFKHALTHEVAYDSLLQDGRRAPHARIVDAIEALYPERLTEQVERLAHQAFWGELWEKAVTDLRQAGGKAPGNLGGAGALGVPGVPDPAQSTPRTRREPGAWTRSMKAMDQKQEAGPGWTRSAVVVGTGSRL
jgi:hypothetical protein